LYPFLPPILVILTCLLASFPPAQPSEEEAMRPSPITALALVLLAAALLPLACIAQSKPGDPMPPRSRVDKDTGHRVWRLSDEPNSGGFYFNINAYTPDSKQMVYAAPDGIHVLDMATRATKLLVANPKGAIDASFAAEVAKADNPPPADVVPTPDLAKRFNPTDPPNSKGPIVPAARPATPPAAQ